MTPNSASDGHLGWERTEWEERVERKEGRVEENGAGEREAGGQVRCMGKSPNEANGKVRCLRRASTIAANFITFCFFVGGPACPSLSNRC